MGYLSGLFFIVGLALAYWFWLRPLLKSRPQFADFYARTDSFWAAARMKFNTIKTRFAAGLLMVASVLVELHDFLIPAIAPIDWTPLTSKVPAAVWPIVSLAVAALFLWLRNLTARTQAVEVAAVAAGASPRQAAVLAEKEPA